MVAGGRAGGDSHGLRMEARGTPAPQPLGALEAADTMMAADRHDRQTGMAKHAARPPLRATPALGFYIPIPEQDGSCGEDDRPVAKKTRYCQRACRRAACVTAVTYQRIRCARLGATGRARQSVPLRLCLWTCSGPAMDSLAAKKCPSAKKRRFQDLICRPVVKTGLGGVRAGQKKKTRRPSPVFTALPKALPRHATCPAQQHLTGQNLLARR